MFSCIYLSDKDLIREREQDGNGASREADNPMPHVNQAPDLYTGMMFTINLYTGVFLNDGHKLCFHQHLSEGNLNREIERDGNFTPHEATTHDVPSGIIHHC